MDQAPRPADLLAAEEDYFAQRDGAVRGWFNPTAPAGVSVVEHVRSLAVLVLDIQTEVWKVTNRVPSAVVAGHVAVAYLTANEPFTRERPVYGFVGTLYRQTEIFAATPEGDFGVGPGELWLMYARYHDLADDERILGRPVGIITIDGYEETALEQLARQSK